MSEAPAGRPIKPIAADRLRERLRKSAFAYLNRYAASQAHFAGVLRRKLGRWADMGLIEADSVDAAGLVAAVVADVAALGLLDDRAFADGRTASLRRKGGSRRKIALGLRAKGVDAETAAAALAAADIDEAEAALRLARRRRLGPWRVEPRSDDRAGRDRDIGVLVRQGFAYSLARQVIGMGLEEAEERLAGG